MERMKPMEPDRVRRLARTVQKAVFEQLGVESTSAFQADLVEMDTAFAIKNVEDGFEMDFDVPVNCEYGDGELLTVYERVRVTVRAL